MNTNRNTINLVQLISPASAIQTTARIAKQISEAQKIENKLANIEEREIESRNSYLKLGVMAAGCAIDLVYLVFLSQGASYFISDQNLNGAIMTGIGIVGKMYCQGIINGGEEHEVRKLDELRKRYKNYFKPERQ
ncbi:hypothetical protein J4437_02255 [Candidatus Woesearchaeota archaeon]|nr:hypothetical protein [Candidatus Woesearchaeota archaeon]